MGKKGGVPIGILNFGSKGHFTRISYNDRFLYNIERSTGNCSNCSDTPNEQPLNERYQKFNQNSLAFSYNPSGRRASNGYWAVAWRFERLMYIKHTMFPKKGGPQNGAHFISWGGGFQHINWRERFEAELSLNTFLQASYGKRFNFLGSRYLYITARLNNHIYKNQNFEIPAPFTLIESINEDISYQFWVGYAVGIQI